MNNKIKKAIQLAKNRYDSWNEQLIGYIASDYKKFGKITPSQSDFINYYLSNV